MPKGIKLETPDKVKLFADYDDVMKRILAESKREVDNLNNQREMLILKNVQLDQDLVRKQGQFEQWKRVEDQKLQDIKFKLNNEVIAREKRLEVGELDLSRRITEVARRETLGIKLVDKETKLYNDRIEVEKLRSSAGVLMDDANRKMSDALSKFSQANIAEQKSKELFNKANSINESLTKREHEVNEKEKDVNLRLKNLEEVQKVVDPKLKEITEIEKRIEKTRKENIEKEQEIERKISEEKVMFKDLEELKKKSDIRSKQLDQKEEEVTRKALLAGIKDAK